MTSVAVCAAILVAAAAVPGPEPAAAARETAYRTGVPALDPGAGEGVEARLDGRPLPRPALRNAGRDRYAAIETDWAPHRLELTIR